MYVKSAFYRTELLKNALIGQNISELVVGSGVVLEIVHEAEFS